MQVFGVRMLRFRRAAFAVHPSRIAVSIMLFLPDGQAMLYLIDDEPAGIEGFAAVGRAHAHPYGHLAHGQPPHAVDAQGMLHPNTPQCSPPDPAPFLPSHLLPLLLL